ncbi:MAG: radical SAM/Cys-rich domain protein [Nitrospirae bacterium]|nr:MAG: radical SAM/Cys-rich domain protein [Nitrospirota bacterium]
MKPLPMTPLAVSAHHTSRADGRWQGFSDTLLRHGLDPLIAESIRILQVNVGKVCNQTCVHCHVDAGPHRSELMSWETMTLVLDAIRRTPSITTVDITGGAPEMNPHFEKLVRACRDLGRHVIDRCNLTVFFVKGKEHVPQFLAEHRVEIVASLPCYLEENVDEQRGRGVFKRSLLALEQLNRLGYGIEGTGLILNLVYNPIGPRLPPDQTTLEEEYKAELWTRYGILFNRLYTITNMPINRFLDELVSSNRLGAYMNELVNSFNPAAVAGVMCRSLVNVGWDGRLYDCDFNQMLDLPLAAPSPQTIAEFDASGLASRRIRTGEHCLGCTAGSGSSCQGALAF